MARLQNRLGHLNMPMGLSHCCCNQSQSPTAMVVPDGYRDRNAL